MKLLTILLMLLTSVIKEYTLKVEETFPHDDNAYTQGLFFHEGVMYESCGQYGESSFRKVNYRTGDILSITHFDRRYFLEGSCVVGGYLYILTWMEHVCFVYDLKSMNKVGEFYLQGEGWGLTTDGSSLILSDGTSIIRFLDPQTFMEKKQITVKVNGKELAYINELEYIDGFIWANVYGTDYIAIIDPENGKVVGRIDCRNLLPPQLKTKNTDVQNGIALNPLTGDVFLTGKNWPKTYRISLVERR